MRLLQFLHEAKPSSINGVIGLYLQLDSRIMPRNQYSRSKTSMYCAPPFIIPAYYFLQNSGLMSKVMLIVILFTLHLYIPYCAILLSPRGAIRGGLTVILMLCLKQF